MGPTAFRAGTAQTDADNPWPGLASYGEQDSERFKGRETEIEGLFSLVRGSRVSVLYGTSGLGKTSLLRAGLGPRLFDAGELPVHLRLDFSDTAAAFDTQIVAGIAAAAQANDVEMPPRAAGQSLWAWLHRRQSAFWGRRNQLMLPVLILDQFEEIFTRGLVVPARAEAVRALLSALADLAEGRPPQALMAEIDRDPDAAAGYDFGQHRYRLLFSLREDFLAPLDELRAQMPSIMAARYRLQPMDGRQALRVVDQTHGRLVDTAVAEQIVRIAAGRPLHDDFPPALPDLRVDSALLGLFCRELNRRRQAARQPRITADDVREGHRNILEAFYEECIRPVAPALRRWVEDELITANGHRDSRVVEDAMLLPGVAARDIDALVDARLLRAEERNGVRRIELSHDVLTRVVRRSRDARQLAEKLQAEQATEHERLERAKKDAELEALRQGQRANVEAQQRADEAERAGRALRRRLFALGAVTAAAVALGVFAWVKAQQAGRALEEARAATEEARAATEQMQATAQANAAALQAAREALGAASAALARPGPTPVGPPPTASSPTGWPAPASAPAPSDARALLAQATRTYDSARVESQRLATCPAGMRVYPHVADDEGKATVADLVPALRSAGFIVPAAEVVATSMLPAKPSLRYFRRSEIEGGQAAAAALQKAGVRDVTLSYVAGFEDSKAIRPCHYEIWLPPEATRR